jgi:hypothetical protein
MLTVLGAGTTGSKTGLMEGSTGCWSLLHTVLVAGSASKVTTFSVQAWSKFKFKAAA